MIPRPNPPSVDGGQMDNNSLYAPHAAQWGLGHRLVTGWYTKVTTGNGHQGLAYLYSIHIKDRPTKGSPAGAL